jgi:hypothetical protein
MIAGVGSRCAIASNVRGAGGQSPRDEWGRTRLSLSFRVPIIT